MSSTCRGTGGFWQGWWWERHCPGGVQSSRGLFWVQLLAAAHLSPLWARHIPKSLDYSRNEGSLTREWNFTFPARLPQECPLCVPWARNPKAAPAPHALPGLQLSLPTEKRSFRAQFQCSGCPQRSSGALSQSRSWEQRGADEGTASLLSLTQVRVCSFLAFTTQGWDVGTCFLCSIP